MPGHLKPIIPPSLTTFALLCAMFAASVWVFISLVRRETHHRLRLTLIRWAGRNQLKWVDPNELLRMPVPPPLKDLNPAFLKLITGPTTHITQITTAATGLAPNPGAHWNLLLRKMDAHWPATALRPTVHKQSFVDLYPLSSFPSLMPTERFVVFGTEPAPARRLAHSSAAALLPPDVGLLILGQYLILDFTDRTFDEIEFDRMLDLIHQLVPRLSAAGAEQQGLSVLSIR